MIVRTLLRTFQSKVVRQETETEIKEGHKTPTKQNEKKNKSTSMGLSPVKGNGELSMLRVCYGC